jgi:hypothetical protein
LPADSHPAAPGMVWFILIVQLRCAENATAGPNLSALRPQ